MSAPTPGSSVPYWYAPGVLHVIAENAEALQSQLNAAVLQLRETAADNDRRGILITRRSRSLFTVEVSADVPYGTTLEEDRWQRHLLTQPPTWGDEAGR